VTFNNCTDTSNCVNVVVNSISVKSNELEVSIYPNLTVGQFTIEFYENIEKGMA